MNDVLPDVADCGSETDREALCALLCQPAWGAPPHLDAPFKMLPSGVYFAPDLHSWQMLEPTEQAVLAPPEGLGERVEADGVSPNWCRVLPFPYTEHQLLRFAEYALLPRLCEWMERDEWHPPLRLDPALDALTEAPRAFSLAVFLAGGAAPDKPQTPIEITELAPTAPALLAELPPDATRWTPERRSKLLELFREFGGKRPAESGRKGTWGALAKLSRETGIDKDTARVQLDKAIVEKRGAELWARLNTAR